LDSLNLLVIQCKRTRMG